MESFVVADFYQDLLRLAGFNMILLSDICNSLLNNGLRCTKIRKQCESFYFICQEDQGEVHVSILSLYSKSSSSTGKCFISLSNYPPGDASLEEKRFEGKLLEKVIIIISEFLKNDNRISGSLWLTKDRFMNYLKEVAEFDHF
jgi:hypothetical protein